MFHKNLWFRNEETSDGGRKGVETGVGRLLGPIGNELDTGR